MINKRKKFIVYPKFQITIIFVNLVTSLLCLGAVMIQTNLAFKAMRTLGVQSNLGPNQPYFQFLDLQEKTFVTYLSLAFLCGAALSLVATIIFSHRIAGPLVRLKNFFTEMRDTKKVPDHPLKFRKNDFCYDLAPIVNEALREALKTTKRS